MSKEMDRLDFWGSKARARRAIRHPHPRGKHHHPSWDYRLPAEYQLRPASHKTVIAQIRQAIREETRKAS